MIEVMENRFKNKIGITVITFLLLIGYLNESLAQVKFNQHNPYVTNSEIHHLRNMGIDLFTEPYTDPEFKQNIFLTLDLKKEYNAHQAKYAALGVSSLLGILVGIAGVLVDQDTNTNAVGTNGQPISQTSIKSQYILLGAAGTIAAGFTFKARNKRNASKSKFEQQLQITKDQYSLLR